METGSGIDARLRRAAESARQSLLEQRSEAGHWTGELSSSALSTATATAALTRALVERPKGAARLERLVAGGRAWLARHRNPDGGHGDTVDSPSNLSTTALAWMALAVPLEADEDGDIALARADCETWLRRRLGALDAPALAKALGEVYGEDRTFAVPILTACALSGALDGPGNPDPWRSIPALPFELAALPQSLFRWLGLPVVSYALPALIAIGQAIEFHRPSRNPLARIARAATRRSTLRVLTRIQPVNGGFLEATPLTSFVLLSLLSIGAGASQVARRSLQFLVASARPDGSWPIDTNLATWVTTLAVNGLGDALPETARATLRDWLLAQQLGARHPYTGAAPGGWAWTDLPGGVPDADDTAGALLALRRLEPEAVAAAQAGLDWLAALQNKDGGIPTFCRGWGKLPFDRSSPDLTAHALRAWTSWDARPDSVRRAARYLVESQRADGAWVPLWFGNQEEPRLENPVYGTSRVLRVAGRAREERPLAQALERGLDWLLAAQRTDGGFGGGPGLRATVEETALALEALCDAHRAGLRDLRRPVAAATEWLLEATHSGTRFEARPIGLYFARLWYSERLYPLLFAVSALSGAERVLAR